MNKDFIICEKNTRLIDAYIGDEYRRHPLHIKVLYAMSKINNTCYITQKGIKEAVKKGLPSGACVEWPFLCLYGPKAVITWGDDIDTQRKEFELANPYESLYAGVLVFIRWLNANRDSLVHFDDNYMEKDND